MSRQRPQRGAAVVEFAFLCGLLLMFLLGIFEFGFLWLQSNYLANAAREGARVAAKKMDDTLRCGAAEAAATKYLAGSRLFSTDGSTLKAGILDTFECDDDVTISSDPPVNGVSFAMTINADKVWNPVLFRFIVAVLPDADADALNAYSDNLKKLRHSAVYAKEIN